jgi:GT2 family glycosyltransferase
MTTRCWRPAVSCVLIFFNGESFIEEAICSVVGQQGIDDWELILVDDGSTDASTGIAEKWAERDPARIRYATHPGHENRGMSAARNLGISLAKGEYVAFLDCDDVWLPSALAHRMRVARSHPAADVVIGGTWRWYSWSGSSDDLDRDHHVCLPRELPWLTTIEPPALFGAIYGTPGTYCVPAMCGLLVRHNALISAGGMSEEFRGLYEDQVLYTKIALTMRVVLDGRALALYRQHSSSACSTSIDNGQWSPTARSSAEDRFLEWQRHYVGVTSGVDSTEVGIVEANATRSDSSPVPRVGMARRLRGAIIGGRDAPARERERRVPGATRHDPPEQLFELVARMRRRLQGLFASAGPTVIGDWSAQYLSAYATRRTGRVLVVTGQTASPDGWTSEIANRATPKADVFVTRQLRDLDETAGFDHIIFTFGAYRATNPAELLTYSRSHLSPSGTISALFAGKAYGGPRSITSASLKALAVEALPARVVSVETFGNPVTVTPARRQSRAITVRGVDIDFHTADTEVMVALSAGPRTDYQRAEVDG